jgi:hypothetical protein
MLLVLTVPPQPTLTPVAWSGRKPAFMQACTCMFLVILAPTQHTVFFVQLSVQLVTEFPVVVEFIGPSLQSQKPNPGIYSYPF